MADWGPDGGGMRIDSQTGLGCRLLHITPEDSYEQQPLVHDDCLLVAHVRLDNRAELCRDLRLTDRPDLPDSAIVVAAWRRYGLECVQHLQGDWVFALWDRISRRLILARCATGTVGLFWYRRDGELLFATGVRGLLAHPDCVRTLDTRHIACLLTASEDPEDDATVYDHIRLLEPGHLLIATNGGVERRRWWQPENLAPLRLPHAEQYYEAFRELYGTVVGQFLRVGDGGIAATLSGGLDSGSVVAMAAARLNSPLKAYVHAPLYETPGSTRRIGNELPQAMRLAEHVGNVEVLPLHSPHTSLMGGIEHGLRVHAVPAHASAHEYWLFDILANARADGVRVLLTGQGGNSTVSYSGNGNLLPLVFGGQLRHALAALRCERTGLSLAVKRRLIKPLIEPARNYLRQRRSLRSSIVNPEPAKALKNRQAAVRPFSRVAAFRLGLAGAGRSRSRWMADGAAHGLQVRDPTYDRRVVEFCWRLPDEVFWANGLQRGLMRVGMVGYLPADILDETRKGLQSADILARVRAQSAEIDAAIERIAGSATAGYYLDAAALRRIFDRIVAGGNSMSMVSEGHVLARGLSAGYFLASQTG